MFKVGTLPIMNRAEFVREGMMAKSPKKGSSKEMAMVPYSPKEMAMVPYSPKEMAMVEYKKGSPKKYLKRLGQDRKNLEEYFARLDKEGIYTYKTPEESVSPVKKASPVAKKTVKCTTNKNGTPPCADGYTSNKNKKGEDCCYKTKKTKSPVKEVTPKKTSPVAKKTVKCTTNKNGTPPCADGYTSNKNKKGEDCCYKTKKTKSPVKEVTPKKTSPVAKKTVKCTTNRNGTPPCADGYTSNKNKKGEDCCYKTKK